MTDTIKHPARGRAAGRLGELAATFNSACNSIPASVPQAVLRVAVAVPFLKSGVRKWDGFLQLSDTAVLLFREEFRLHILGGTYAYPAPGAAAFLAGGAEIVLPVLLIVGLGARFAALGLLVMTGVIQLTVPDGWASFHLPWAAMLLAILAYGPGKLSLDHLIEKARR